MDAWEVLLTKSTTGDAWQRLNAALTERPTVYEGRAIIETTPASQAITTAPQAEILNALPLTEAIIATTLTEALTATPCQIISL